jgi:aspartate aminotransferase-like enzyme
MLYDAIQRSDVDAVTLVHSETSTGALAPAEQLADVVQEFDDVLLLMDGVTSVAASPVETDLWQLDFVFTGAQKALALPPGLAFGVASERMCDRAKSLPDRGAYFDLLAFQKAALEHQPTNTPAIPLLFALDAQCERISREGGIEARWRRHDEMRKTVERWVEGPGGDLGFRFLPAEGRRSWSVSCLTVPEHSRGRELAQGMADRGCTIGAGYGPLKDTTIRIGHMGDHTVDELIELLHTLEELCT